MDTPNYKIINPSIKIVNRTERIVKRNLLMQVQFSLNRLNKIGLTTV